MQPPRKDGFQFPVISSGRPFAFTTLEVLNQRDSIYIDDTPRVFDPSAPNERRPARYAGVFIGRYDQSTGTGVNARIGPALYDDRNP